jgi:WD40 repeat protein
VLDEILFTGSYDGFIRLWVISSGEISKILSGKRNIYLIKANRLPVYVLALYQRLLYASHSDKTVKAWNFTAEKVVRTFSGK